MQLPDWKGPLDWYLSKLLDATYIEIFLELRDVFHNFDAHPSTVGRCCYRVVITGAAIETTPGTLARCRVVLIGKDIGGSFAGQTHHAEVYNKGWYKIATTVKTFGALCKTYNLIISDAGKTSYRYGKLLKEKPINIYCQNFHHKSCPFQLEGFQIYFLFSFSTRWFPRTPSIYLHLVVTHAPSSLWHVPRSLQTSYPIPSPCVPISGCEKASL